MAGNTEQQAPLSEAFTTVSATAPSFCAGDGSSAPCPCGNQSALGAGEGCLNSLGTGGKLVASGAPSIAQADLLLTGSRMPSGTAAYFQGHSAAAGGQGVAFGDGLLCVSGSVFRLGLKLNVNGTSRYPDPDDPPVSVRGYTLPGAQRVYQCWYRNSADFCTASLFNLTNGLRVTWAP